MRKGVWLIPLMALLITGCAVQGMRDNTDNTAKEPVYVAPGIGDYDSADTAVISDINEKEQTISFLNLVRGRHYTLTYDGATTIRSRYEKGMSMAQLKEGDIVDVTFMKSNKRLNSIQISPSSWEESGVTQFEISDKNGDLVISSGEYNISEDLVIVSNGEPAEMMDLNRRDIVTVKGIAHNIYSIVVDKGHGYLRLKNDEYFIGGWIEVGKTLIQPVTEDMLLTVPEGNYEVLITNGGNGGMKEISVARDEEIELDIGDLEIQETKKGSILFAVTPSTARVYIDGDAVDTSSKVEMEYGIHQLIVRAEGYETITQYIKVGQPYASLDIELEKSETDENRKDTDAIGKNPQEEYAYGTLSGNQTNKNETPSDNKGKEENKNNNKDKDKNNVSGNDTDKKGDTTSGNDVTDTTGRYKVKIEGPKGAEVYLDGNYIGIAPVNFKKAPGSHEITLRKNGYKTRSYTIQIDKEKKDVTWTFSDLVRENEDEKTNNKEDDKNE